MASAAAERCKRRFLRFFPEGFEDETYLDWERGYKEAAAREWQSVFSRSRFEQKLATGEYRQIAAQAIRIESRTNLLFSFEKMALRDATRTPAGARLFAAGLYQFLYGDDTEEIRFTRWCDTVASLPRRQTRVLTWPVVTVFGFIGAPHRHVFLKPNVTRIAVARYGIELPYDSRPAWPTYQALLILVATIRRDLADLRPRDMIDLQSFLWVVGSEEYSGRTFKAAHTTRVPAARLHSRSERASRTVT